MVKKKIRTEYMKKFKDPKWETFSKCYEDLLNYRLSRRMLEQSHNPILWGGCETDSESSGRSTPPKNKICPVTAEEMPPRETRKQEGDASEPTAVERELQADTSSPTDRQGAERVQRNGEIGAEVKHEGGPSAGDLVQDHRVPPKPLRSRKPKSLRAKSKPPPATAAGTASRHPFAMYGWAEQHADMAGKKTHNVLPAVSTTEIHASALRAKTRREVEKQMKNLQRQRVRSAEPKKAHKTEPVADYNPWITEYMRCFSSRTR
ncbi:centriole, cilia and spindle-associated protein-like [Anguilla rostrata]|uniref:Centriole, cilia and spindle-associated protein a n=1 Tax=Anguilla anguilla TaxID=7936 RepID=A0A9D3RI93_ANGAN|nr:hypothetical protein ANANG_G00301850 [Anguilla anguilla]